MFSKKKRKESIIGKPYSLVTRLLYITLIDNLPFATLFLLFGAFSLLFFFFLNGFPTLSIAYDLFSAAFFFYFFNFVVVRANYLNGGLVLLG